MRDVIFPSDPFTHVDSGRYTGDEILKVRDCHSNAVWIKAAFGEDVFGKLADKVSVWDQAFDIKMLLLLDGFPFQRVPWNGFVATVAQAGAEHLRVNGDGLVEVEGRVPTILHQYDRHPPIQEHIHATYR